MTGRRRRALADEAGMTMIEVLVALAISVIVIGASTQFFVLSNGSALSGRRQVSALALAQSQIEKVRQQVKQYGFGTLGMSSVPAKAGADTDTSNPTDFENTAATTWEVQENYDAPGIPLLTEPLITGGTITPIQTITGSDGVVAKVYTFVSQATDICQVGLPASVCTAAGVTTASNMDVRRVVVAVVLNAPTGQTQNGGPNKPQYLTTLITNPVPSAQINNVTGLRIGLNVS
ncbi:MAG TPA: prepilin-type N-terminal cleavage/methylation domain-containing protein [Solirubrobacteraceae bacterium]|nr:prepilin-type N-terminal cleavage/methylation domain-containing protein [Solirubrobacteraceae bacterium]